MGKGYFAGIDSGSTSTDVVILDKDQNIVTGIICRQVREQQLEQSVHWKKR